MAENTEDSPLWKLMQLPSQPYYEAVGRFISSFSLLEVNMQLALWTFAHLSKPMARALLAGSTRIDAAMNLISKIAEAEKWDKVEKDELQYLFTQLGTINKVRNDLLHFGATPDDATKVWTISNKDFATAADQLRITKLTVQDLSDLNSDVAQITLRMVLLAWGGNLKPETRYLFEQSKRDTWRYKSPPPTDDHRKTRRKPQGQPRQPKPSRASRRKDAMKRRGES